MSSGPQHVFHIGGITFAIEDEQFSQREIGPRYQQFLSPQPAAATLRTHHKGLPQLALDDAARVFDSEMLWSFYEIEQQKILVLKSPVPGVLSNRVAIFNADFSQGELHCAPVGPEAATDTRYLPDSLRFPLFQLWTINLLAQGRGLMVHACAINDNGHGYLFLGHSTDGKSTMARQWQGEGVVLNDDRIIIRQHEGRFWVYGTPWHGDHDDVSPHGVPLDRVFFLRQAATNHAQRMHGAQAVTYLLPRSFAPLWDANGVAFTLDFCSQLASDVPCYDLGVMPTRDIVDFVRHLNFG